MKKKIDLEERVKIVLLGSSGVGKTSIINRYGQNVFDKHSETTYSTNKLEKDITINNNTIPVEIWDTAGQEKYRSISRLYTKNAKIIILVYDITNKDSFSDLYYWYNFIKNDLNQEVVLGLAGNKVDLIQDGYNEEVSKSKAKESAENWKAIFSLISAKVDKKGIDDYFEKLIMKYISIEKEEKNEKKNIKITKNNEKKNKKKGRFC